MFSIFPKGDEDQRLRIKRFFMAAGSYALWVLIFLLYYQGNLVRIEGHYIVPILGLIVLCNVVFYSLIRSGFNKRFADASLTLAQMVVATIWAMAFVYFTDQARGALLLLYLVVFVFGLFRMQRRQFLVLAFFAVASYSLVIYLLFVFHPERIDTRVELFNIIVLAFVLPWFAFVGGYISRLRQQLKAAFSIIEKLAIYDDLTQVFNRRQLFKILEHQKALSDRGNESFAICLFDIDYFKQVNDSFGHEKGDAVLKTVAQIIHNQLRVIDYIARYGGEEFLMILPNSDLHNAVIAAERVRLITEKITFDDFPEDFHVTISVGITAYHPSEPITATINRADKALYMAKHNGRNRVECFPAEPYHPERTGKNG